MRPMVAGVAAALLLGGCVHGPQARPAREGERIDLDELSVRVPAGPGWSVLDVQVGSERIVSLLHGGPAGADRKLEIAQTVGTPSYVTPLDDARGAPLAPGAVDPAAGSPRFGPLSARFAFRAGPRRGTPPGVTVLATTWLFAVPPRLDRGYRVTYLEGAPLPADEATSRMSEAAARAEAAFDQVEIYPPDAPRPRTTPPALLVRPATGLAVGPAQVRLMGASALGLDERLAFGVELSQPARGRGTTWDVGVRVAGGKHDGASIAAVLLEPGFALAWGPARFRVGPDLGVGLRQDRGSLTVRQRAVLGGAATLAVDVHRGERIDLFVEAGAAAGTERFSSLALRLGLSLH